MELNDLDGPEFEIAQMAAEGFSVRHIAARLDLTERAAAARLRIVFAKLGVRDRRELRTKIGATDWEEALGKIRAFIEAHGHSRVKGALIPIVALTRGFPLAPVRLVRNPETVPMMADGSLLRS
jgi:Bacterial regulatory proteins, luxR family